MRVAFGTVSTTVMRSFNGVARRASQAKAFDGHLARLLNLIVRCRLILIWGTRSCSRVCSDASATLTVSGTQDKN